MREPADNPSVVRHETHQRVGVHALRERTGILSLQLIVPDETSQSLGRTRGDDSSGQPGHGVGLHPERFPAKLERAPGAGMPRAPPEQRSAIGKSQTRGCFKRALCWDRRSNSHTEGRSPANHLAARR